MDHELVLRYVSTLGFPICMSAALGYALWKIGSKLLDSHLATIAAVTLEAATNAKAIIEIQHQMGKVSASLEEPICKASQHFPGSKRS